MSDATRWLVTERSRDSRSIATSQRSLYGIVTILDLFKTMVVIAWSNRDRESIAQVILRQASDRVPQSILVREYVWLHGNQDTFRTVWMMK